MAERFDLRALQPDKLLGTAPAVVPMADSGLAVVFRYGVAVFFNLDSLAEAAARAQLMTVAANRFDTPETEEADLVIDPGGAERVAADGAVILGEATIERVVVVADVLAKSVAMDFYESRVDAVFDRIEPVARGLHGGVWRGEGSMRDLLAHIGDVLATRHRMIGRVEVTEKPDLLWDHPELERLYARLEDEYELAERDRALTRKLDLIAQTASTSLGLLQERRSLRVEWYIVILIVVEIVLSLYALFFHSGGH